MLSRRNWVLRLSIILNVIVLCYVGTHFVTYNNVDLIEDIQATGRNLAVIEYNTKLAGLNTFQQVRDVKPIYSQTKREFEPSARISERETFQINKTSEIQVTGDEGTKNGESVESVVMSIPLKYFGSRSNDLGPKTTQTEVNVSTSYAETPSVSSGGSPIKRTLEDVIKCHDSKQSRRTHQRGEFWVLYNYILSSRTFRCFETVTYTTHSDYTFLDNLEPLLERWRGPVSLALHAPGTDFNTTVYAIQYLRKCTTPLVEELVSFHLYFGSKYVPKKLLTPEEAMNLQVNCSLPPPWTNVTTKQLFKSQKKILYPVNVGRNIAREAAVTYYILPSDIELYPSPGLIDKFLAMILRQDPPLHRKNPKVFPLPIFELEADASIPPNKTELVKMLKTGRAIPFHKKVCAGCHTIPKFKEWVLANETEDLHVFHIGKRTGYYLHWEPIFIGTHFDPLYDERLSWEGKSDKMTQWNRIEIRAGYNGARETHQDSTNEGTCSAILFGSSE
ncbi:hypothetical protein RUM43_010332 [Polyplax serrata]|uniref:N-acetyllactosaminide beta-1,3-N-acetylglucosaminyltransferase n=1 Tax=Polyplax serrata TaxID=468196 RepID=A0AAN8S9Y9_POLSC